MSGTTDPKYTFTGPACGESLTVNESMREALVEKGCVICGTALIRESFPPDATADSP